MVSADVLDAASSRPADLDLDALWEQLRHNVEERGTALDVEMLVRMEWAELVLTMIRPQLVAEPACHDQDDGWVRVRASFRGLLPARGVLLGFGTAVHVLAPAELRADMAATAAAVARLYQG